MQSWSAAKAENDRLFALSQPFVPKPVAPPPPPPPPPPPSCYEATLTGDKFSCPLCGSKEGGTLRIISHYLIDGKDCPNKYKEYCQKERGFKGGRRKTKKARRNRRRYSRRN